MNTYPCTAAVIIAKLMTTCANASAREKYLSNEAHRARVRLTQAAQMLEIKKNVERQEIALRQCMALSDTQS